MGKALYVWAALLFVCLIGCQSGNGAKEEPPPRVQLIPKGPEDAVEEKGIDAVPETDAIYLEWLPVNDPDLVAYDIFRQANDSSGTFVQVGSVERLFANEILPTSFIDSTVTLNVRYYYYVEARDEAGLSSDPSAKVSYMLVDKPTLQSPSGVMQDTLFVWDFSDNYVPLEFVFRLERKEGETFVPFHLYVGNLQFNLLAHQEWGLSRMQLNSMPPGFYRWRIDVLGSEPNQGAESNWKTFVVQP